ncbi:MAG: CocE/NonD family hydrolase [Steroidobacteraceae bacterium]
MKHLEYRHPLPTAAPSRRLAAVVIAVTALGAALAPAGVAAAARAAASSMASAAASTVATEPGASPAPLLPPASGDIPAEFKRPTAQDDYERREVMIPMRDGVKLHTVIVLPRAARGAPMLLTRTPYDASGRARRFDSPHMLATLPMGDEVFVRDGYIRVFQDVRGKDKSEGDYVMTRPVRGPLNAAATDHVTDAWDTIEWLVHNVPESNGRVGMLGSSYEGFTVVMALLDPHPALKVAAPESPMIDGWMGDDWFHYGAFRQVNLDYFTEQMTDKGEGKGVPRGGHDDYQLFLRAGSAGSFARAAGLEQLPFWQRLSQHPAYDAFWQGQALDRLIARKPLTVPTLWEQGLWDQEDMWGAVHSYAAAKAAGTPDELNHLVLGPWRHSQVNYEGFGLGPLRFEGDTALQFRRDMLKPFFDQYLKDGAPKFALPAAILYDTGLNRWERFDRWPVACESGCRAPLKALYLQAQSGLAFDRPAKDPKAFDEYVSDPAKPVPYQQRPVRFEDGDAWKKWLVMDQRPFSDRPDVLVYETPPLTAPLHLAGAPIAELFASTSGTDADWVVKLIDVYPDEVPSQPELGGYQLGIAMDIFRGRYRDSFEKPSAIPAGKVQRYRYALPTVNHVFQPGHRIMVQVQSSWFPLYDRNPQRFVPNIFFAAPGDYAKATQRVFRGGENASAVWLPVAP